MNKRLLSLIKFLTITLFCMQLSRQSTQMHEKPAINFKGTITRVNDEKVYEVDNITISGLYQKIPVYALPDNKDIDPAEDITFIDLAEIQEMRPTHANPHEGIRTFKNRDYIEITIVFKDSQKTTENFIIETSRKIFCDRLNEAGPIEKELAFPSLKKLIITGYSSRDDKIGNTYIDNNNEKSAAQKALCNQTSSLINNLQSETKKVQPPHTKEKISDIVDELKETTDALCS